MLGIGSAQLAQMRAQVVDLLPSTCSLYAAGTAVDGAGAPVYTWTLVADGSDLGCRVDPLVRTSDEIELTANRPELTETYRLTLPYDAPIEPHHRVSVSGRGDFEIISLSAEHSWNVSQRAIIAKRG
jgi:hypothetical protein